MYVKLQRLLRSRLAKDASLLPMVIHFVLVPQVLIKTISMFIVTTKLVIILGKFQIFLKVLIENFINIELMNYMKWIVGVHACVYISDFCII